MKVLVTGGAGFIGSHVVDALITEGYEVTVVDDLSTGRKENLNPRARFYNLDIRHPELGEVFSKERPDYVNHHAAQASVRISVEKPTHDAEVNIIGSLNLIENCIRYGVKKIIYISSGGAVYGEPLRLPCDEDHPINPICHYGITKHTVEHYLYLYCQLYGLRYTILRYPNVYGPRQDPYGEAGVVAIFSRQMLRGEKVVINGSGEQERDFLYVSDVVRANLLALEKGDGSIFNLGWGVGTSVNQLCVRLKELTGYTKDPTYGTLKAGEIFKIRLSAIRAAQQLGWQPLVELDDGLRKTVEYFRAQT